MMTRPVTLFTGQWTDLPFTEVARLAAEWGYDGLELACWGDHLDPNRGAVDDDPIDQRHRGILPDSIWGDGDPEGIRQRAAEEMKNTARTAARLGAKVVTGFAGSSIWKYVAMFPPVP